MSQNTKPVMLYLGCGNDRMKDFIHVEINLWKHQTGYPDVLADISEKIPLADNVADLVFSRATMEHLTYTELLNCLLESRRVLKRGGVVRMVLPDLDKLVENYRNKVHSTDIESGPDMPNSDYVETFVAQITYHDHFYNHTFETMRRALAKAGFDNIRRCNIADSIIKVANEELKKAEVGRHYEMIIEATKLDREPTAAYTPKKWPRNIILKFFAKYLNWRISAYSDRKAKFPHKFWFKGLFFNEQRQMKKVFPWNIVSEK
ncbi:MAG TPA: methyltransferase domain-containing protein [Candidatus Paceibacterota bacterium]